MFTLIISFANGANEYTYSAKSRGAITREVNKWRNGYILAALPAKEGEVRFKAFQSIPLNMRKVLHITVHGEDTKMEGLRSISTSCKKNPICQARAKVPGSICEKCYAQTYLKMRPGLRDWTEWNYDILNAGILDKRDLPDIYDDVFRLESFGDSATETDVINKLHLCEKNPGTWFTVWTKNVDIYGRVFKAGYKKPKNLIIIISSFMINVVADISKYKWADKVFTVFESEEVARALGYEINCGNQSDISAGLKRKCRRCMKCYGRQALKTDIYINELLK